MRDTKLRKSLACILLAVTCLVSCGSESGKNKQTIESGHSKMTGQTQNSTDKNEETAVHFAYEKRTVRLNSGCDMPILGLGTWTQDDKAAEASVYTALKDGYRPIDPAHILENISIYDFELTDEEMKQMAALHTGRRYENW